MSAVYMASRFLAPTLKELPSDAVAASHRLLLRAGFVRQLGAGLYNVLPLGRRSLAKLERILREEMEAVGAQEFQLPSLQPADLWRSSGRWDEIDQTMFRLQDRRGGDYCLAMTHEEVFTAIARAELRSYRQLPQRWFQISLKFRDEPRPKGGLLRTREFHMKDAYSFDIDTTGLDRAFEDMRAAYERIFARCGVEALPAEAFSGAMGGRESIEFVAQTPAGEDEVVRCAACGYVANVEVARSRLQSGSCDDPERRSPDMLEEFPTPGALTIEALAVAPYNIPAERQLKTLVYVADGQPIVAVVRGDHVLNEAKLQVASRTTGVRPAAADEIFALMGAHAGSLGGVRFQRAPLFVDEALAGRTNMVTGANRDGFHLRGVDVERDLLKSSASASIADLRLVSAGEGCPRCEGSLQGFSALEVGHIFRLGTRYSDRLDATVLDASGVATPLVMGSYGIGLGRLLAAVVEQHHDADGILWPMALAPFAASVLLLGAEHDLVRLADQTLDALVAAGLDVLYDDRDERPGVKFKDADLIGVPLRVSVGPRGLAAGGVEWKQRGAATSEIVRLGNVTARARALVVEDERLHRRVAGDVGRSP